MSTQQVSSQVFFTKNDPEDPRLGERTRHLDWMNIPSNACVLLGYPDDEGIRLNGGRLGAHEAPLSIRKHLFKMTPPATAEFPEQIYDGGQLDLDGPLLVRHLRAQSLVSQLLGANCFPITLGGGHDYGFPDAAGFVEHHVSAKDPKRPLVINFDAHLDVRPDDKGFHSGTPFRRLLNLFSGQLDFVEVGLQPQCNSSTHWEWALKQGAHLLKRDQSSLETTTSLFAKFKPGQPVWISLDIDVIQQSEAPGCSAPSPGGMDYQTLRSWLFSLWKYFDVKGIGIYEVSPALDRDDQTSRLAAQVIFDQLILFKQKMDR